MLLDSGTPPYWFVHARDGEIGSDFEPGNLYAVARVEGSLRGTLTRRRGDRR